MAMVTGCRPQSSPTARISLFRLRDRVRETESSTHHDPAQPNGTGFRTAAGYAPADLAQSQFDVRKLLLERLIHVLLQVGRFDVLDDRRLRGEEHKDTSEEGRKRGMSP